jgi:hypothetical protein
MSESMKGGAARASEDLGDRSVGKGVSAISDVLAELRRAPRSPSPDDPEPSARKDIVGPAHAVPAPVGLKEAVGWVFEHLEVAEVAMPDAPSPGCWTMLLWAREDRKAFFGLWQKAFAKDAEIKKQVSDDGRELFDLLERLSKLAKDSEHEVGRG